MGTSLLSRTLDRVDCFEDKVSIGISFGCTVDETVIGISLNSVADARGSFLCLVVAVVVIGTSLSTVGTELETKDNVLEGAGEEMETSFRGMLAGSTGMA